MYIGSWKIDDLVTFSVNTHNTLGVEIDADAAPTYRVYEDETGTAILTGSMAKLDDANTVGYYSEQLTLSAANGFEKGKSYNIRITGTVGGTTGSTVRTLQIEAEVDANSVSDKTGYSGVVTGTVVLTDGSLTTAKLGAFVLQKTTHITGFNDIAAGAAMTLTSGERDATAVVVESHLLDEGDSQLLINAIVGAIGNTNVDEAILVAAIRADLERNGGNLNTLITRLTNTRATNLDFLDAGILSRTLPAANYATVANQTTLLAGQTTINNNVITVDTVVDFIKVVTDRLATSIVVDGAVYQFTANALELAPTGGGSTPPTVQEIADGVWDELLSGHAIVGSAGAALSAAGTAGDPLLGEVEPASAGGAAVTLKDAMRLFLSFLCGLTTGGGTDTIVFRDINNQLNRLSITVDENSNRLSVSRSVL